MLNKITVKIIRDDTFERYVVERIFRKKGGKNKKLVSKSR